MLRMMMPHPPRPPLRRLATSAALAALASLLLLDGCVLPTRPSYDEGWNRHLASVRVEDKRGGGEDEMVGGGGDGVGTTTTDVDPDLYRTMQTFYEPIDPDTRARPRTAVAMNRTLEEGDTVDAWREAWEAMGWKTKVLSLKDAKKHPDYDKFLLGLENVPLGENVYYNKMRYLRWLAMASSGGGWMSDYDVVPIAPPPPPPSSSSSGESNEFGRFTSYGGHAPYLMRGSADEWTRMARLLLDTAKARGWALSIGRGGKRGGGFKKTTFSDGTGLLYTRKPPGMYFVSTEEVLREKSGVARLAGRHVAEGRGFKPEECDYLIGKFRAVHFGSAALAESVGTDGGGTLDRRSMIRGWTAMFGERCGGRAKAKAKGPRPEGGREARQERTELKA